MKLFERLMTALLAGVLAVGMLAGCSGTNAPKAPEVPTDVDALAVYNEYQKALENFNFDVELAYNKELSEIAADYAKAQAVTNYTAKQNAQNAALTRLSSVTTLDNVIYCTASAGKYTEPTAEDSYKNYYSTLKTALTSPNRANYMGIAVVDVNGTKYTCTIFVRADKAAV